MKICVISSTVFAIPTPGYSGLEHLAWQIGAGLAAKGYVVSVVAPDGSSCPGATIIPIGPPGQWDEKTAYSKYWQLLPDFDVIIDHSWTKWSYVLKQEGKLKTPVLGVCHAPVNTMYQSLPPVENPCFVCISKDQANHFQALFGREAKVARNGVDFDFYKPMNIKRSDRFLFLARFSSIKGPDIAIEACKKLGVGLDLVGDTSITNEPEFLVKCKSMVDGKQIRFVGPASRGECVRWFSQAHCLLHPNQRFREPFGLAPVESLGCGCPVIAWDHGAMRETIQHNETGWLVRSIAELERAIITASQRLFGDYRRNYCREWASQFSVQNMIDRYEELCKEAVESGGW